MRQAWEPEDLIKVWTLLEDDMKRVRNKSGATRLGFALLLKFFEVEARFPESAKEVPAAAVEYVAQQVKVPAGAWADYDWQSKAIQRHRGEIRAAYGFRANTEEDQDRLAAWLATELCPVELSRDRLAAGDAVVARCRNDRIEPPAYSRRAAQPMMSSAIDRSSLRSVGLKSMETFLPDGERIRMLRQGELYGLEQMPTHPFVQHGWPMGPPQRPGRVWKVALQH